MNAKEIIQLLETPTPDRRPTVRQITEEAAIPRLIVAVQEATTPLTRQLLCDILGTRGDKQAVSVLINALQENVSKVRSSAADALAKIGDAQAGEALMKRLEIEESDGVKSALIYALGAVDYKPAIPLLIPNLSNPDRAIRYCAAQSLGEMHAQEAKDALQRALNMESNTYTAQIMREALTVINVAH